MLRSVVPPPSPEMILSILSPSAAKKPFSIATAHGSVAVTRPYWLTAISAAREGAQQTIRIATTIGYAQRQRGISFLPDLSGIMSCPLERRNHGQLRQFAVRGSAPTYGYGAPKVLFSGQRHRSLIRHFSHSGRRATQV